MEFQGAEAKVVVNDDVEKKRFEKSYRHSELDEKIRKNRNSREADLIRQASRAGVKVPQILEEKEFGLKMQRIEGKILKQELTEESSEELGSNIAKLHEADIMHGDLTTSNVIVSDSVYVIDFGLSFRSERIEDRAMDLHMFKQILRSSHPEKMERCWKSFLEGYSGYGKYEEVISRLEKVEMRGRYKT